MLQNHTLQFEFGSLTLNDQQYEIVQAPLNQHLRVLASAGSGKTTTITAKIAHTITHLGIKAEEVVLTTFSRSGADTMRERLEKLIGSTTAYIGTFHALSLQILRQNDPTAIEGIMHTVDELPYLWLDFLKTDKGKAWSFVAVERNIYLSDDYKTAWFDELLTTQMKICRGSGVLIQQNGKWKIAHYVLSMTIPNENTNEVVTIKSKFDENLLRELQKR
jgi:superfamily I DNA/RNA helicase